MGGDPALAVVLVTVAKVDDGGVIEGEPVIVVVLALVGVTDTEPCDVLVAVGVAVPGTHWK